MPPRYRKAGTLRRIPSGRMGSYLSDKYEISFSPEGATYIHRMAVNTLHLNLQVPVTAKFRVFLSVEKTVEYAKMLERAGAQIITCHGRTREQRGVLSVRSKPRRLADHLLTITRG